MNTNNAILITIFILFLGLGYVTPYIHSAYGQSETSNVDVEGITDLGQADLGTTTITSGDIIFSIATMFFWTFGALPVWLDLFLVVLRVILYVILYDKIRGI